MYVRQRLLPAKEDPQHRLGTVSRPIEDQARTFPHANSADADFTWRSQVCPHSFQNRFLRAPARIRFCSVRDAELIKFRSCLGFTLRTQRAGTTSATDLARRKERAHLGAAVGSQDFPTGQCGLVLLLSQRRGGSRSGESRSIQALARTAAVASWPPGPPESKPVP